MIKKVPVGSLRPGMYVHDLGLGWMDHPFPFSHFALKTDDQVAELVALGLQTVLIDTDKGDDVPDAQTEEEARADATAKLMLVATEKPRENRVVSVAEEIARARQLHQRAGVVVRDIMRDARLGKAVHAENVAALVDDITQSVVRNSGALLSMLRLKNKDDYTFLHCVSVGTLMVTFGRSLGLEGEDLRQAGIGGFVHDVGKMKVSDAILNKPAKLTDAEFALIREHPAAGHAILVESSGVGADPLEITLHHHERMDGRGYPHKLPGASLSLLARMASVVDVYDAITSDRCYHKGLEPTEALRRMVEWAEGGQFDGDLLKRFIRCVGIYPTGTLVRLDSGLLAVVTDQNPKELVKPRVRAFFSTRQNCYVAPHEIDLAKAPADRIVSDEDPRKWGVDPNRFLAAA